jgi:hypothetical protein
MSWLGLFGGSDLWLPVIRDDVPSDRRDARIDYLVALAAASAPARRASRVVPWPRCATTDRPWGRKFDKLGVSVPRFLTTRKWRNWQTR